MTNQTKSTIILLQIISIIVLGVFIYSNSLNNKFIWDDYFGIRDNVFIKNWSNLKNIFLKQIWASAGYKSLFYRPLLSVTYMLDYSFWGLNVVGYHLTSMLLHTLVGLCLYWLVSTLFNNRIISFLTSILFVVHPIQVETVGFISSRTDILVALFILLCFIFYIKYLYLESIKAYTLIFLTYLFALLSKENALTFPLLLLLYHYVFQKRVDRRKFLFISGISLIYVVFRLTIIEFPLSYPLSLPILFQRIPGFFAAIIDYLRLVLFPFGLHMAYSDKLFRFTEPKVILGLGSFLLALIYAFNKKRNDRLIPFSLCWFFITLLPTSNIYPIISDSYMAERWLYLPSIGLFVIFADKLYLIYKQKRFQAVAALFIIAILTLYSYLTIKQNNYWKEPIAFYKRTLRYNPYAVKLLENLGNEYSAIGNYEEAIKLYRKVIELNPHIAQTYNNLGVAYANLGNTNEAIAFYKKATELGPDFPQVYNNMGNVYASRSSNNEAMAFYKKAIELNPNYVDAYINLGAVYKNLGQKEEAILLFKKAIQINPSFELAYYRLIDIYKIDGAKDEIMSLYRQIIKHNINYFDAYYIIGNLYSDAGRDKEATLLYKKAIQINPQSAQGYSNLGGSYCVIGKNKDAIISLKKAIELDSSLAVAYNNLALAYYYEKKYDLAVKYLDKAIELGYKVRPRFLDLLKPYRK